jgi:DNA polymerase sigma
MCVLDGMERVICVHAKVPIVKIWDPELKLACDMNVNNTLALENTRMIRTYVDIDRRVRPLAMIVKYWTRRRVLNDAGACSTISDHKFSQLISTLSAWRHSKLLHLDLPDNQLPTNKRPADFAESPSAAAQATGHGKWCPFFFR